MSTDCPKEAASSEKIQSPKVLVIKRSPQTQAALARLTEGVKAWAEWSGKRKWPFPFRISNN